ncbi:MAG: DsbA family protein, partial [Roseomonas sp.]|nr:DsbA family protein [Roseomonas sp.]
MRTEHPLTIQSGPRDAFIHESYRQWFQGGQEPGSNANLIEGLRAIGQLPDRVMELANGAAIDQALTEETDTARALGIFGAPTFVVGDQLFWGDDLREAVMRPGDHGFTVAMLAIPRFGTTLPGTRPSAPSSMGNAITAISMAATARISPSRFLTNPRMVGRAISTAQANQNRAAA